jgi:hypothetical protein
MRAGLKGLKYRKIRLLADVNQFLNYKSLTSWLGKETLEPSFSFSELWKQLEPRISMKTPLAPRKMQIPADRADWNLMKAQILSARDSDFEDIPEDDIIVIGDKPNVVDLIPSYPCKANIPKEIQQQLQSFDFYKVEFYTKLLPKQGHKVKQLRLSLLLSPSMTVKMRPSAYDIFPHTQWKTILKINIDTEIEVGISFHLGYVAKLFAQRGFAAKADGGVSIKILSDSVRLLWRKALIESGGQGSTCIDWRYRSKELLGDLRVMLIMKARKTVGTVSAVMSGAAVIQTGRLKKETFPFRVIPQEFELVPV